MSWTQQSIDDVKAAARLENIVSQITKLKREGEILVGRCCLPGHPNDDTPSFQVSIQKQVYHCKGCGKGGDVVSLVMVTRGLRFHEAMKELSSITGVALVDDVKAQKKRGKVAEYVYRAADGAPLYTIERLEPGKEGRSKDFIQRLPDGTPKKSPVQVLYRLPEVLAAVAAGDVVYVTEGEKACEALVKIGVCATTHAGGASAKKTWTPTFVEPLKKARVVLLPDNDETGSSFMRHVADVVAGVAAEVKVLNLPVDGEGDDAFEWTAAGGDRAKLEQLAIAVPAQAGSEWRQDLRYVGRYLVGSPANLELILEHDPLVADVFAFDEFATRITVTRAPPWRERKGTLPRALVDHDVTRLGIYLERTYGTAFSGVGAVVSSVADRGAFNPLTRWLSSLKWDRTPRLSTWLTTFAGADDTPYTRAVARAWCISAVARAFAPGCQVDHTLVLEGDQGLGKSSLLRALVGKEWFLDHLPDFTSKDAAILVGRAWVHELAELASMSKAEVEKTKQFLSQRDDVFRPPYGTNTKDVPRKCVFAATTNRDDWARDTTGNRRFWPVVTKTLDVAGVGVARLQLWAEAVEAFRAGEPWHLVDADVRAQAVEQQEERLERDPWQGKVAEYCDSFSHRSITLDEVLHHVGVELAKRSSRDAGRCRDILRQLDWKEARPRVDDGKVRKRVWNPPRGPTGPSGPREGGGGSGGSGPLAEAIGPSGPTGPAKNDTPRPLHTTDLFGRGSGVSVPSSTSKSFGPVGPVGQEAGGSRGKRSDLESALLGPVGPDLQDDINATWGGDR